MNPENKISLIIDELINGKKFNKISNMINPNDHIVIGLSGGADSIALTYFLFLLSKHFNLSLFACHVNHGIRRKEADQDQQFVRSFCNKLNIKLFEKKVDLLNLVANSNKSLEELGRDIRYQFFYECSRKYDAKIATAHNMNDNVETIIFNLIRGTGLKGLCGIPMIRKNIIRPFLIFSRQDIEAFCHENNLSFVIDSTNLSTDYSRNLIRHKIIPEFYKINPNFISTINRSCDIILDDEAYLSKVVKSALDNIFYFDDWFYIDKFNQFDHNIKSRIIKQILKNYQLPYNYHKITNIIDFINDINCHKLSLTNFYYIIKKNNLFKIQSRLIKTDNANHLYIDLFDDFGSNNVKDFLNYDIIKYTDIEDDIKSNKAILKQCIDLDKIAGTPVLRHRKNGDKIKLAYRNVTKSLKKLFNEENLLPDVKNNLFVISDDLGVIWIQNFGADIRVNVSENSKNILFLYNFNNFL